MGTISDNTIAAIQQAVRPLTVVIDGVTYSTVKLNDTREPEPETKAIRVAGLAGIVEYLHTHQSEPGFGGDNYIVHVEAFDRVSLVSHPFGRYHQRNVFAVAKAEWPQDLEFGVYEDSEIFLVRLMSLFVDTGVRQQIIAMLGSITDENVAQHEDDGASQTVTVKKGVRLKEIATVPNPVALAPFRTFREVEQPSSLFVLRAQSGNPRPELALFEADGGEWKLNAIALIKSYFESALHDRIESGQVSIIG